MLYDPSVINYSDDELGTISTQRYHNYDISMSQRQFNHLTEITKTQSENINWKLHRAGRITASLCKQAFTTDSEKPAKTFFHSVMQYQEKRSFPAMEYGLNWESVARDCYTELSTQLHMNFTVATTGLHVNSKFKFLGASPDGLVDCTCHGSGVLEIKCPPSFEKGLDGWKGAVRCPVNADGTINKSHQYFYQMQHQMLVTEKKYCDFFVWTKGLKKSDKFLLRVDKDEDCCKEIIKKLEKVFLAVFYLN